MIKISEMSAILEVGDKHQFCYIDDDGIGRVDYGELLEIDTKRKSFTFYSNWYKKIIDGITSVRNVSYIDKAQWWKPPNIHCHNYQLYSLENL